MNTKPSPASKPNITDTAEKVVAAKAPAKKAVSADKPVVKRGVKTTTGPITKAVAKPVVKAAAKPKAEKAVKVKKAKLVRDSFTIPKPEYLVLDELKLRAVKLAQPAKKTELLRAGIKALAAMSDASLLAALKTVPAIKTGRPAKD
ncbi:MAG: hypothetical protein BWK72_19370 [Rhodoferax ferrireducens]|uniref:Uncharacterized protein n=1 Tax=Rhodoferax ferrireducens TaxID=192843 RepID=A0A1W9KPC9_9BURK|nr:MAG: hypothetical protein BWK72_19370 [Rhodoferax ferrireducens]